MIASSKFCLVPYYCDKLRYQCKWFFGITIGLSFVWRIKRLK